MPLVRRALRDLFVLAPYVDAMVNAVNCVGAAGKGIALEYRTRHPAMYTNYKKHCLDGSLHIGKIHTYKDSQTPYTIVNLPTKRHFADASDPDDIKRGLFALRRWLEHPSRQLITLAMPMLGCGEGRLGYEIMEPVFFELLDDLDNVIHLAMLPEKMDHIPKYLAIIGPRAYTDRDAIDRGIQEALWSWGLTWTDFDAIVSGGASGVDSVACGIDRKDPTYEESLTKKYHPALPIICKADWNRFGRSAGMIRNRTVVSIATHVIAFLPQGVPSVGTAGAVSFFRSHNKNLTTEDQKVLYICGEEGEEKETLRHRLIVPENSDDVRD